MPVLSAFTAKAETRTLKLYNTHTKERVEVTFKKNGRFIPSGLREANRFLRDWRRNEMTNIDPKLLDLVWEVYQQVGAKNPIYVVSSYRSPATNNMLRKRSRGVAKNSQHTLGKAMDFYIPGVNLAQLRATGLRQHVGGVGYYPTSGSPFVHMDTGSIRHWPRMTRSQLAKVFPDGKTLHVPSDGKPMSGYKLALAEAKSGKRSTTPTIVASNEEDDEGNVTRGQSLRNSSDLVRPAPREAASGSGGNLLASLFRSNNADSANERTRVAAVRPDSAPVPPGALPGVRNSGDNATPASRTAPVVTAPPVPLQKEEDEATGAEDTVIVASVVPLAKPAVASAPIQVASVAAPNTLDAQRIALETGASPAVANSDRFAAASALPSQKPADALLKATQVAALNQQNVAGSVPLPAQAPTDDPVAAIVAATSGDSQSTPTPVAAPTALAYASATATPAAFSRQNGRPNAAKAGARSTPAKQTLERSVSGRIPRNEIRDPLAGFAGLPDKSETLLISGAGTTRHRLFASLSHPRQRSLKNFLAPGNRFVSTGFELFPYGSLRTDRFEGPAVIVLPVTFAR